MISATIVTIGDELLIGQTIDTNSAWIAQQFNKIGIQIKRRVAIADEESEIIKALNEASAISEIVITTGGLGPTNDDITKATLCKYFDSSLIIDTQVLKHIKTYFDKRGRKLLDVNRDQALVPDNCEVLFNAVGTAPGMKFMKDDTIFFSLPGVPFEMKHLICERIIPQLNNIYTTDKIVHKTLVTSGMGESFIAERLKHFEEKLPATISLAYLPNFGMVKLRLSGSGEIEQELNIHFDDLTQLVHDIIISKTDRSLEKILFDTLLEKEQTVTIAESCTGGNIASKIVSISGASKVFQGSTVTYALESKKRVLHIKEETLNEHTDVSKETALEMAQNVRNLFNADYGLSTTGFLEGTETYFFAAISSKDKTLVKKFTLPYGRNLNSNLAVSISLQFFIRFLIKEA